MKRFRARGLQVLAVTAACAGTMLSASSARADITFYDKDGWSVYTRGLIASHFQYAFGDGDPATTHAILVGGKILPGGAIDPQGQACTDVSPGVAAAQPNAKCATFNLSRVRSGFIGTQLGVGVRRKINDQVKVDSLIAINLADVSSNRNQEANKSVDVREAWAAVETPGGTFKMGRMFMIFGSGSAPIVLISHKFAVGNPCFVNAPTIACASVGAGPLYAGFDAQLRYETPRFVGLQFQAAISDPWISPAYQITALPRVDAEVNFDQSFTEDTRLRVFGQGVWQTIKRRNPVSMDLQSGTVLGMMGTAVFNAGGFAVGGGGYQCEGCGTRMVMEIGEAANPLVHDSQGTFRSTRGFFGNAGYTFFGYTIAAGGGVAFVKPTAQDAPELQIPAQPESTTLSILKSSTAFHGTLTKQIDAVVLTAEYMLWKNQWHYGERQTQNYTGVGANFTW